MKLFPNGSLQISDQNGALRQVGPENPDYPALRKEYDTSARPNPTPARLFGVAAIIVGIAAFWYSWHLLMTENTVSVKLTILGPAAFLGGPLMIWKPEWTGPITVNSSKAHKTALLVLCALIMLLSGIEFFVLLHYQR